MPEVRTIESHSTAVELFRLLDREPRPSAENSPWVMANMVSTLDGRAALNGRSGRLGGPLDRAMCQAIRAIADVILVGAKTVRVERYGPIRLSAGLQEARRESGRTPLPTLAVLSGSLELPDDTGLFDAPERLHVLTGSSTPEADRRALTAIGVAVEPLAPDELDDCMKAYHGLLTGSNEIARMAAAKAWSLWEAQCATLRPNQDVVDHFSDPHTALSLARIEAHYFVNDAFLEPGQLLRDAVRIADIPGYIIHGRYDMVCPVDNAFALHAAWPRAELQIVRVAGHSAAEPGITDALIRAAMEVAGRVRAG